MAQASLPPIVPSHRVDEGQFRRVLEQHGLGQLVRGEVTTLQVNMGKLCNQACHHCHVEAGPKRTEIMPRAVAERVMALLAASLGVGIVDITGGAPELNANFRWMVEESRRLGRAVIDRCNLTILFEPGMDDLPEFLAAHNVEVTASLPCYTAKNVDSQRGPGVFEKSVAALRRFNALGYGRSDSLRLNLIYNPLGAYLPPAQACLEADYKQHLLEEFGIEFHRLFTLTNMPIKRFADYLQQNGKTSEYMGLLVNHFNRATVPHVMCRSLVSVGWDGKLYDCDFNQMLELEMGAFAKGLSIWDIPSLSELGGRPIATGSHCFGCTAGAGSSCGGALT